MRSKRTKGIAVVVVIAAIEWELLVRRVRSTYTEGGNIHPFEGTDVQATTA